jgi:Helix-turn-helix of insertion element transposase
MSQSYPADAKKSLSAKQREAALLLANGTTIARTAAQLGVSEKSVDLWKRKPEFTAALREAEDDLYSESLGLLKRTAKAAVMTLVACMDMKISPYVRVAAASKLLDASMEVHKIQELEARIVELENIRCENTKA